MEEFKERIVNIFTAHQSDLLFFTSSAQLLDQEIGYKLLTFTVLYPSHKQIRRIYSSNPDVYPIGGDKAVPDNYWAELTIRQKTSFIGNNREEIKKYFFDHQTITDLGCESILNQVVVFNDKPIGTVNLLNIENHFRPEHLKITELFSKFVAPFYLDQLVKMGFAEI